VDVSPVGADSLETLRTAEKTSGSLATVSAIEMRALMSDLMAQGVAAATIEGHVELTLAELADADARVPADRYVEALIKGSGWTGDPAFALHFGARCRPAQGGVVYNLAATSATYLEGFELAIRYARLLGDVMRIELETGTELAAFRAQVQNPRFRCRELIEAALGRAAMTMRALWGAAFSLCEARFSTPAPAHAKEHRALFACPIRYESSDDALVLDRRWLLAPQPGHQPYTNELLVRHADDLLSRLADRDTVRSRAQRWVVELLPRGDADVRTVARKLGMSRQTLHRRLAAEGTSFQAMVASLRRETAVAQLASDTLSIAELALLLGYSESSAFYRAFRSWTGESPSEFRAEARRRRGERAG
jgi:AraC-like DNA-binding protein